MSPLDNAQPSSRWPAALRWMMAAAIQASCIATASAQLIVDEPNRTGIVQELDSTSQVIFQQGDDDTGKGPKWRRIELGSPPQTSALGFTAAEVMTSFEHNVVSYWAAVNAYPGAVGGRQRLPGSG